MARVPSIGEGSNYRKVLNHAPEISAAWAGLQKAINESSIAPKTRMLATLAVDHANRCLRY